MIKCDENKPYIFISYAHKDSGKVYEIIRNLEDSGYNVWYDGGIDPGTEWDQNIANHVKGCTYFIAFVSMAYIGSENCKDELNYARDLDKDRLLVYIEDVQLPDGMAMRMNRIQAIFWNKYDSSNIDEAYKKLFSAQGIERAKIGDGSGATFTVPSENVTKASASVEVSENVSVEKKTETTKKENEKFEKKLKFSINLPKWAWIVIGVLGLALIGVFFSPSDGEKEDKNYEGHSLSWYLEESEKGDKTAMLYLADYYYNGLNDSEKNYKEAVRWYEEAAKSKKNAGKAYAYLGICYTQGGYGLEKDDAEAIEWFEKAIDAGTTVVDDIDVYKKLGYIHYADESTVERNRTKAIEYYNKSVENGNTDAYFWIGHCYYLGDDTLTKDYAKSVEFFNKAIESETTSDYERGMSWEVMGHCYYYGGNGVTQDISKAFECYKKYEEIDKVSFEKNKWTMANYAVCYHLSDEEDKYKKAAEWFKKAETMGELNEGLHCYAAGYLYGTGFMSEQADLKKGLEYFNKALEDKTFNVEFRKGNIFVGIGLCHYNLNQYAEAVLELEKAYGMGNSLAALHLGRIYYYGGNGVEKDYDKAYKYMSEAEKNGNGDSKILGEMYYNGLGIEKDYKHAVYYLEKAGDGESLNHIGICYHNGGNGIEKDLNLAFTYFKKSADVGDMYGYYNTGVYYENGYGMEEADLEMAKQYYQKAADLGHEKAKTALERLQKSE